MKLLIYSLLLLSLQIISCKEKNIEVKDISITEVDSTHEIPPPPPAKVSGYLITDTSFGDITSSANLEQLKKLFGQKNITDAIEYGAEGLDSFTATKIYKGTPKEITITWKEKKLHKEIASAECTQDKSPYFTIDSLHIGSTLQKLLEINEKPLNFYGTGWDYGGTITSYNKGKLESSKIFFQLGDKPGVSEKLMGDKEFNTDMPLVKSNLQKLQIVIIRLSFDNDTK